MKARRSLRKKSSAVKPVDYGVSSDEEDRSSRKRAAFSDDDDNFEEAAGEAGPPDEDLDEMMSDDVEQAEREVIRGTGEDDELMDTDVTPAASRPATRIRRGRRRSDKLLKRTDNVHQIPAYPIEVKSTRTYAGPLRRHDRYGLLVDMMYGPNQEHVDNIDYMRERWVNYPVLPSRLATDESGPMANPWVTDEHREELERSFQEWWLRMGNTGGGGPQRSTLLSSEQAQELLPRADGDLAAFLGRHNDQKEHQISSGQSFSLATSGSPILDTQGETPSGWLFEVGGIPLSIAWAPKPDGDQLLAVAVVPETDQAFYKREADKPKEDMKQGSIQLWAFQADQNVEGSMVPSRNAAKRVGALCFDWGRPKRISWCPETPQMESAGGLLAVLAGDGQVRVVQVNAFECSESPQYGTPFASIVDCMPVDGASC